MAKICCGGFELGEGLELNGKTLSVSGGGGIIANAVIGYNEDSEDTPLEVISVDKTPRELMAAYASGTNVVFNIRFSIDGEIDEPDFYVGAAMATDINGTQVVFVSLNRPLHMMDIDVEENADVLGMETEGNVEWTIRLF